MHIREKLDLNLCNKNMRTKKTYNAQALAIIMVILIVASIIGFSVFSRLMTQKRATIQERNSSEALEVADMILDNFLLSKPEDWVEAGMVGNTYKETLFIPENVQGLVDNEISKITTTIHAQDDMIIQTGPDSSSNAITKLTQELGHKLDLQNLNICPLSEHNNEYTLQLSRTNDDTDFPLRPGETFVFPIKGRSFENGCTINITFPNPTDGGFTVNKIFIEGEGIKAYDYADTENYCFSKGISSPISPCGNSNFTGTGWTTSSGSLSIPLNSNLERIQLTAIGSDLTFRFSMSKECTDKIQLWQLRASATCSGTYRAKEVIVPDVGWSYSIFNYVLFNGKGNISSGQ